jgi:hypothetical protein
MRRPAVSMVASAVLLAGCAVPHHRSWTAVDEPAISAGGAARLLVHFNRVREQADSSRDSGVLAGAEAGPLLAVDTGLYHVSRTLSPRRKGARGPWTSATQLFVPRFTRYPLWFVAVVEDTGQGTQVAAVLTRTSVTTPWRVILAPQFAARTRLPAVRTGARGDRVPLSMTARSGLAASPTDTIDHYCAVLEDAGSRFAGGFVPDSFVHQMRSVARSGPGRASQQWSRLPGGYALRTADGGALVLAAVRRQDRYLVVGKPIQWPRGNPASAYQPGPVRGSTTVTYIHQLLMYVPPSGGGRARLLGQAGGIIGARPN